MTSDESTVTDVDAAIDDAIVPRCEMRIRFGGRECSAPADGYRFGSPCGHGTFACIPCRDAWEELRAGVERDTHKEVGVTCDVCAFPVHEIVWRSL